MSIKTLEAQNQIQFDDYLQQGSAKMGPWTSHIWRTDPRHLSFLLSRYKFCAKMLEGKNDILEIGCGDAFGMPIVLQNVKSVHGVDIEPIVINDAKVRLAEERMKECTFEVLDITKSATDKVFDAVYSLDVIEHIPAELEKNFMGNIVGSLQEDGLCIIGTPNLEAHKYASPGSAAGHINLKTGKTLRELLSAHFSNVFIFSMNDEVIHTGFHPMAHYLFGIGVGLKRGK